MNMHPHSLTSWRQLQTELRDLAFLLDRQGSHSAAELAVSLAAGFDQFLAQSPIVVETQQDEVP
jgi:hypothetical protein